MKIPLQYCHIFKEIQTNMADGLLTPGEQIQPQIDLRAAAELAEKLYGVKVESATELDGYDDKNYFLKVTEPPNNKFIPQLWSPGYVFKIMNSSDSKKLDYVEAQCEIIMHLDKHRIRTPVPQRNIHGDFYCVVELESEDTENTKIRKEHVVRMMTFQEGTLMKDIPWSYALHYEVGRYTAQIDLILKFYCIIIRFNLQSTWEYAGAQLFNMLPKDLKDCSPQILKKTLNTWLIGESIYSLEEFKNIANTRLEARNLKQ